MKEKKYIEKYKYIIIYRKINYKRIFYNYKQYFSYISISKSNKKINKNV
jgi:hypothetical protein